MSASYIKLYGIDAKPDEAYFLEEGNVFFYASDADKYAIKGKSLIIGSSEIILNYMLDMETGRLESAVADQGSRIKRLGRDKFLASMESFSFVLNVSIVLAKQVLLTNQIIGKNTRSLAVDDSKAQGMAIEYYKIVSRIKAEYDKRRLPWLSELVSKFETSLTYKRGEAFGKAAEETRISSEVALNDKYIEYATGSIICEEKTTGDELYILKTGMIDVFVQGNKVTTIGEPGAVFGEMALLLGEKRTATLKAKNNVVITRIKKEDLKEVFQKDSSILMSLVTSLAKKHYHNINKLQSINKLILDQQVDTEVDGIKKNKLDGNKIFIELKNLKNAVRELYDKKEATFLDDLINEYAI